MNIEHYNELIDLSQEIYDQAADRVANYCASKYCGIGNETIEPELTDYVMVAFESSAYFFGNALALLTPDSQEKHINAFVDKLRMVIADAQKALGSDQKPN